MFYEQVMVITGTVGRISGGHYFLRFLLLFLMISPIYLKVHAKIEK